MVHKRIQIIGVGLLLVLVLGARLGVAQSNGAVGTPEPTSPSEPEPQPEVTAEPEGGVEPEPEAEAESEPEPEGEPTAEPAADSPFAEPVPAWDVALPKYGWAWPFHIYLLGVLFALLALYSLGSIIKLRQRRLLSYGYFIALNLLMLLMGTLRAIYLLVDAYNYKMIWPNVVAYLFLGTGFPCLTSAFSVLFLALLQSTKTRLVPPTIQKAKYLAVVITAHFLFAFIADVVVGTYASAAALLLACQVAFVIWGVFLTVSYLVIFRRLHRSSTRKFRELSRLSVRTASVHFPGERPAIKPRNNWGSAIKITLVTALLGLLIALLQVYGMLVVYGPVAGQKQIPDPWPWWSYQFIFRVLEFLMCALMSFVATQPFRYTKDGKEKPCPCLPCWQSICGKKESMSLEQEDDLNSHVWSSAFEPCLPQKPNMHTGPAAETTYRDVMSFSTANTNGNNPRSVNVNFQRSGSTGKIKDKALKLEAFNEMRRAKSTDAISTGPEMNNSVKTPQAAPTPAKPFSDTSVGLVVKNELQAPAKRGDKVTNCCSVPVTPSKDMKTEHFELDRASSHHSMSNLTLSSQEPEVMPPTSPQASADFSLEVTEETPLNPVSP